jgi:N-acetylmuramoyl-L-alanine amidase
MPPRSRTAPADPRGETWGDRGWALAALGLVLAAIWSLGQAWPLTSALVDGAGPEAVRPLIVIDPGHGGTDPGTQGGGLKEKDLALDVATRVAWELESRGQRVWLSRPGDRTVPLEDRSALANDQGAALFVSLHFDNAGQPGARASGVEILHTPRKEWSAARQLAARLGVETGDPAVAAESVRLGECVLRAVVAATGVANRGMREQDLSVCRLTTCPAVLLEGGFLSSEADLALLRTTDHRAALARGVAEGVIAFLAQPRPES